jgi:hypothetical protein
MESVSLYSEARNEYLKQMASWLSSPIVEFFRAEYQKISARDPAKAMSSFQTWCADVPKWNQDVIDTNVSIVLDTCRCDYVEELMTAVFIAIAIPFAIILSFMAEVFDLTGYKIPKIKCFDKNTLIVMDDGSSKKISEIKIGELLQNNNENSIIK